MLSVTTSNLDLSENQLQNWMSRLGTHKSPYATIKRSLFCACVDAWTTFTQVAGQIFREERSLKGYIIKTELNGRRAKGREDYQHWLAEWAIGLQKEANLCKRERETDAPKGAESRRHEYITGYRMKKVREQNRPSDFSLNWRKASPPWLPFHKDNLPWFCYTEATGNRENTARQ